jgi:flagellar basal body-associated protein FliL
MLKQSNQSLFAILLCVASAAFTGVTGCSSPQTADAALAAAFDLTEEEPIQASSEVPIGYFRISVPFQMTEYRVWYRITFDLALGVATDDESEVAEFIEQHEQRLRHDVASAFRQAETDDLKNARLSELRVRLVDAINRQIGKPLVKDVYLANFGAEVQ